MHTAYDIYDISQIYSRFITLLNRLKKKMLLNQKSIFLYYGWFCLVSILTVESNVVPSNFTLPPDSPNNCFVGQFKLDFDVKYPEKNGSYSTVNFVLDNSTYSIYRGSCDEGGDNTTHKLQIFMNMNLWHVELYFHLNKNMASLYQTSVSIIFDDELFPNADPSVLGKTYTATKNVSLFSTDQTKSYRCNTRTTVAFDMQRNVTITLGLQDVHIQSFYDSSKPFSGYGVEEVCGGDKNKSSNLVPIIVGICLAVLVVIVLIAYLIGRRKQRDGYQSV
ncbi:unnamed protein product [Didymodactylos carnosus]|uniref:Lysosome-associated membrane glycoprotein 5 n=1 Tax=Didymodactylos carnosus TaxID=1234261 RepID=A0A813SUS5_9BILA|nr:unnamed protein product [Didymodactylos carnosus]CAF0800103.1 unnamed protein product [Didymodactylos carnosus]CAF3507018.1 unnamed protein product [Didymodactylos carnosus]CAF3585051.1 unnamed protein product [Didymodactylos carnosus]